MPFRRLFGRSWDEGRLEVGPAPANLRPAALASVLGTGAPQAPSFERRAAEQGIDLRHLWVARDGEAIAAAAVLIPHPGRTALLMSTDPKDEAHARIVAATCAGLVRAADPTAVRLVQALMSPGEALRAESWRGAGLRHLATLDYMERALPASAMAGSAPGGIALRPWDPSAREELQGLLARTYVDSLDCPGLAELRDPADILAGHLAAGEHDPALWTVAWRGGSPVATLLLSPSRATESIEIVYLGIVPEERGKGLGKGLLAHGLRQADARSERTIALAVDARNGPALALYAGAGFRAVRRREAFVAAVGA